MRIFSALHNKGTESETVALVTAGEYLLLCKTVSLGTAVITSYSAIIAVVAAVIRKLYQTSDVHLIAVVFSAPNVGGLCKRLVEAVVFNQLPQLVIGSVCGIKKLFCDVATVHSLTSIYLLKR